MSRDFVLDASITVSWCFEDESEPLVTLAWQTLREHTEFVPAHWPLEVANSLLTAERRGRITTQEADAFWRTLAQARIHEDDQTRARACPTTTDLGRTHGLTAYDAAYLELAMRLDLALATLDKKLVRAAASVGVSMLQTP